VIVAILGGLIFVALLAWWMQPKQGYLPDPEDPLDDGVPAPIDRAALEAAEREVRELDAHARPDDERPEEDWGPGVPRTPTPPST
jgi:hypothetical protein